LHLTILLATYNGQKYLPELLDSIIGQTYKGWSLLVHDDGSTDNTLNILHLYAEQDKRIRLLEDEIHGLGAAQNFLHLLRIADADLIMFCDQDDIWLPDKIEVMIKHIDPFGSPAMSYCNANTYKEGRVLPEKLIMFHVTGLKNTLFLNGGIHGCLQIINRPLRDIVVDYKGYACMHDHLITLAAICFGAVRYVDETLMYYRQHGENVTIGYETNTGRKVRKFLTSEVPVIDRDHYNATIGFYEHFNSKMSPEQKQVFLAYRQFAVSSLPERIKILLKYQFMIGRTGSILLFKTILRKAIGSRSD
jgi:rhamnosyltransferase